ncbi:helix-turn-helix transcriptional regulator [Sphaerisporangium corydalis]|uniref:Helix-turn-helix transcriptional regulator n=1 Tax=Sphaerisporangium corydalis TaxID=1441875 RepID=A0ABV9EPG4_9ACTN|nr:helix-turn-helix transcriptional regulator [Sphaerisporangium corydalis]
MDSERLLGDFLRARRETTSLEDAGLTRIGHRRTPGLRREEVAMLAGVSTDYYIRLEQGRERRPSEQVLGALARVLDMDEDATEHLHELAYPWARRRGPITRTEQVIPSLRRLLGKWDHTPAFVLGRWMDMLAVNPLAEALYAGLEHNDNLIRMVFLNPESKRFYRDWEQVAYVKAAHLRAVAGTDPDDPFLPELVEELSAGSEEFRRLWARHDVRPKRSEVKRFHHREVGDLTLSYEAFTVNSTPGQHLVLLQADPGTPSEQALILLAALNGAPGGPARLPSSGPVLGASLGVPAPTHWRTRW